MINFVNFFLSTIYFPRTGYKFFKFFIRSKIFKNIVIASFFGYLIGILFSYILAKIWVFQNKSRQKNKQTKHVNKRSKRKIMKSFQEMTEYLEN